MALFLLSGCLRAVEQMPLDAGLYASDGGMDGGGVLDECEGRAHFYWLGTSSTGPADGGIAVRSISSFGDDWFVTDLHQAELRGRRIGTTIPSDARYVTARGVRLLLPESRNEVVLTVAGIGLHCAVLHRRQSLQGPYQYEAKDVRVGWVFDVVRDGGVVLSF